MEKCDALLNLPQFQKQLATKDPISTEEKKFRNKLDKMRKRGLISEEFYKKVVPCGSQPARFYGLAKVRKKDTPLRPIVSMPGSVYHKLSLEIAEWLKKLPEANINTKVKDVQTALSALHLEDDEEIVSLDVESLFTNVPVHETISLAAELLYADENDDTPDIDKETFVTLLEMVSVNVMFTSRTCDYYRQIDGVAMGSPVGPLLANIFLSQYDSEIGLHSKLCFQHMNYIVRTMIRGGENLLLQFVNTLHPNLRFTLEKETAEHGLPFFNISVTYQ